MRMAVPGRFKQAVCLIASCSPAANTPQASVLNPMKYSVKPKTGAIPRLIPPSLPPRSDGDSYWEPGLREAIVIIGLLAAYWSGWFNGLWPF